MFKELSRVALSILIFGIYVLFIGISFLFFPEIMFTFLAEPNPPSIASRELGMIFLFLSYYYIRSALDEEGMKKFFMWTVHARSTIIIFFTVFVLLGLGNPIIIVFGAVDFAMAAWTFWELRKEKIKR